MGKIFNCIVCIFLLCNCNNSSVPEARLDNPGLLDSVVPRPDTVALPVDTFAMQVDTALPFDTFSMQVDTVVHLAPTRALPDVYNSYIGVREATGKNDGPEVEMFLKSVGLGKGYPWCAAFVKYCMLEAMVPGVERINGMALSCENKQNIIYAKRTEYAEPREGDVFTLYYANLKRIGHTGFHHRRINSSVYESVEGNTNAAGSREGDGVYKKKRSYNATHSISRWP